MSTKEVSIQQANEMKEFADGVLHLFNEVSHNNNLFKTYALHGTQPARVGRYSINLLSSG